MVELTATQALQRGVAAHKEGKPQVAERFYRAILKSEPQLPATEHNKIVLAEAYTNLGVALQQMGNLESAIEHYRKAIAIRPDYIQVYYTLGLALRNSGDLKASIDCYRQAVERMPNDVDALNNLGAALQHSGELNAAIESYQKALEIDPGCVEVLNNMGIALQANLDLGAAIDAYRQAISINPAYANAHSNLGHALRDKGDLESSIECYKAALNINPKSAQAHNNMGNALREAENYREALEHFDFITAIEANPANPQFWFNARSQALECLYHLERYSELEQRLKTLADSGDTNLRIAAVSAFVSHQLKFDDPYPFCRKPLDFLHVGNLSEHVSDVESFVDDLALEASRENQVWEPMHGVTKIGYQTSPTIFGAGANCEALQKILRNEIAAYHAKFGAEDCTYMNRWPEKYALRGWLARLVKKGYQTPHNHPSGWLSGVVYLKTIDSGESDEGAIELGLHGHELPVLDADYPRKTHQPKRGDIVLFPSSLFHRTIPFSADTERCVIAFDLYRH